jgi:hypothetical protein
VDAAQARPQLGAQAEPDRMHGAKRIARALARISIAAIECDRPVNRFDDLQQSNLGRWPREPHAAVDTALREDDLLGGQAREDLGEESSRYVLPPRNFFRRDQLVVRSKGELQNGTNGIIGLLRDFQDRSLLNRTNLVRNEDTSKEDRSEVTGVIDHPRECHRPKQIARIE